MYDDDDDAKVRSVNVLKAIKIIVAAVAVASFICFLVILGCGYVLARYDVVTASYSGEAELVKARQTKLIIIQQANAEKEAEILRAEGTAQANKIIGESLKNNESYLQWLWINRLDNQSNKTFVYVPTTGLIPNLESGRVGIGNK